MRVRADSLKHLGTEMILQKSISQENDNKVIENGEYGYLWAEQYKGDKWALPSMQEVVSGLYKTYCGMVREKLKDGRQDRLKDYLKEKKEVFGELYNCLNPETLAHPLTVDILKDPNSAEVCLLLYLYSIEPPFYASLISASRHLDKEKLKILGPWARALYTLLIQGWESDGKRDDVLKYGQ